MPEIPEDLDVFHLPHVHMKKLVQDIQDHLSCANFSDVGAYSSLLNFLSTNFHEFQSHEEIETQYIVTPLLPRLPSNTKTTLEIDLHSDSRLQELVSLVNDGLQLECSSDRERVAFGELLKESIAKFTVDFIPHMNEEEEVFLPLLLEHFTELELRQLTQMVIELHHLHLHPSQEAIPEPSRSGGGTTREAKSPHISRKPTNGPATSTTTTTTTPSSNPPSPSRPSLLGLPPEILLKILSYLPPSELCLLSQLNSTLNTLAFDGSLWQHVHPVRWARGHLQFFSPISLEGERKEGLSHDLVVENDIAKQLLSVEGHVNANLRGMSEEEEEGYLDHEAGVLLGVLEHLLPRVGRHVHSLDLAYGKAVSNEVVFRMLRHCPNLRYLDLSHTGVSDFAFRGLLGHHHNLWRLEYVDLTGCSLITDTTLQRISRALRPSSSHMHTLTTLASCCCWGGGGRGGGGGGGEGGGGRGGGGGGGGGAVGESGGRREGEPQLKCLILSGCHHITDVGLRSLAGGGTLPQLQYLDLSGLSSITERGLSDLVSACPSLVPELLFYCDNIQEGPYAKCANGCQNVGSSGLCCRSFEV